MSIVNSLVYKVEAVHVLGLLLLGKHRRRTQKMVSEMKLIPGLSAVFENFVWKVRGNRTGAHDRLAGHNPSCQCSPEVAIKIQVMRVIHSFCDHSEYKHLMLTRSELAEVQRINEKAGLLQIQGLDQVDKNNMCKGKVGLLAKIVEVLKKEPTDSTFCFWFCRVIDSYLRGTTSFCDQVFLLRRGVLQHIVGKLLDGEQKTKEILQSSFDLLAELMKFNIEAFKIAEDVLRTTELRKKFRELTNSYIVDSNMFIRSTILSYFFFCNEQPEYADYSKNVNYMLSYIGDFQHQVNYLHELVSLTTVHNISQVR
ncbi:TRPC4AP [Bugula neritina]|uniref:TRPC4AP n=1 Tax=Bugula neritina TaxID=10212 RepID=A0A7J7JD65_BUGNE|nr:TRPC4AP [Bugula neritina]